MNNEFYHDSFNDEIWPLKTSSISKVSNNELPMNSNQSVQWNMHPEYFKHQRKSSWQVPTLRFLYSNYHKRSSISETCRFCDCPAITDCNWPSEIKIFKIAPVQDLHAMLRGYVSRRYQKQGRRVRNAGKEEETKMEGGKRRGSGMGEDNSEIRGTKISRLRCGNFCWSRGWHCYFLVYSWGWSGPGDFVRPSRINGRENECHLFRNTHREDPRGIHEKAKWRNSVTYVLAGKVPRDRGKFLRGKSRYLVGPCNLYTKWIMAAFMAVSSQGI